MNVLRILYLLVLLALAVAVVLVSNWLLDVLILFIDPSLTMTPEGDSLFALLLRGIFLIFDIITIIAIFKWLRR